MDAMKRIYKYQLEITDQQIIEMPKGTELLSAQFQGKNLCVWALVSPDYEVKKGVKQYGFRIFGTGHEIDVEIEDPSENSNEGRFKFLATVQQFSGDLVWHIFYR